MKTNRTKTGGRKLWGGAAAATLGVLLAAPSSGWLVRQQMLMASSGAFRQATEFMAPSKYGDSARAADAARIAAQNPRDVALQIAAQQRRLPTSQTANNDGIAPDAAADRRAHCLVPLLQNYNDQPALHATILRFLSQSSVHIADRPDEICILKNEPPGKTEAAPGKSHTLPADLLLWEQSAQAGEKLDPDNAYFPLMRSVGLFAAHRDKEALVALRRAGEKSRYNEYTTEENEGQWRLNEQAYGKTGFITEMAISAGQLFPHYAQIRQAARLAMVNAIQSEMAGDKEGGYQTRMALTRVSGLMGTGSKTLIGAFVGRAVGCLAWTRPGGALPLPKITKNSSDEAVQNKRMQENLDRYCAYLDQIGHGDAVQEVRWNNAAGEKYRQLWRSAENTPDNIFQMRPAFRLIALWAVGLGLLTNIFSVLIAGGLFAFFARNERIRAGLPLTHGARAGLFCALVLPAYGLFVALTWPETVSLVLLAGGGGALALAGGLLVRATRCASKRGPVPDTQLVPVAPRPAVAFVKTLAVTLLVVCGLGMVGSVGAVQTIQAGNAVMGSWFMGSKPETNPLVMVLLGSAVSSAVPLLLVMGFAIGGRIKRVPASVNVVRGFRRFALQTAAALVIIYAGVVCQTLRDEARASHALQTCVEQGEAQYLSDLLHQPNIIPYPVTPLTKGTQTK